MAGLEHYQKYGWMVSEKNLQTLPETAPQAAKDLTKWLTLAGRQQSLTEWLGCVNPTDSRIHGKFWHIGAWTQRMSHSSPNQANIFSAFSGEPKTPVEEIKAKYDYYLRDLWQAEPGKWLVGTDAEGIQLRILTHYMKSETWKKAILAGKKEDETDIHSMNKKALGSVCRDRDTAKTFIYAWVLGASIPKVAEILNCTVKQASAANNQFLDSFPELRKLKQHKIPTDASRGYFIGLDGRKVQCNSEHLMLAGYLQNGEATIMKHANVLWRKNVTRPYKQVDFVHDEWQTECNTEEDANWIGLQQAIAIADVGQKLNLFCPLTGRYEIGRTWASTH
jgi:DNA polymerase-1